MKASAGTILIKPNGTWNSTTTYKVLNLVKHNDKSYIARKTNVGIEPGTDNEEYWYMFLDPTELMKFKADGVGIGFEVVDGIPYMTYDDSLVYEDGQLVREASDADIDTAIDETFDDDPTNDAAPDEIIDNMVDEIFNS